MTEQNKSVLSLIVGVIVAIGGAWYFFGGGLEKQTRNTMQNLEDQVAVDYLKQYEIAKRSGTPVDVCVQAGLVSAAYLQANDELNYQRAKQIESEDCARAGVPK
jgi:hypothetical protein